MEQGKEAPKTNKWITIVDKLAKGDITRHTVIYGINYVHALNMLGHWKEIDKQKE
jgi:hypothetical protein